MIHRGDSMIKTYNITEFAELMGVSVKTLRRLDKSGMLVADRVLNNQYRYTDKHIQQFEESRKNYLKNRSVDRKSYPDNLIGQRFGKLVVIDYADFNISPQGRRRLQWKCHCDCGNDTLAMDNSLRAGYKKSCGCLLHGTDEAKRMRDEFEKLSEMDAEKLLDLLNPKCENQKKPIRKRSTGVLQDLTNQKFGLWTVLKRGDTRYYKSGGQSVCWVCRCECGTIKTVPGRDLKSGASQSCGCLSSSWLEFHTKQYLIDHSFEFEVQKSYPDLRGICGALLYYDFLVLKNNKPFCLIECQGEQHYRPIKKFGGAKKLLKQIKNDEIKKSYAKDILQIPLYEILYDNMSKQDVYTALDTFFESSSEL